MTTSLLVTGTLGVVTTAYAFMANRRLFVGGRAGRVSVLEGLFYFFGVASLSAMGSWPANA